MPPQRLAPFSYALGAEIKHPETAIIPERSEGDAFGRLYKEAGQDPGVEAVLTKVDAQGRLLEGFSLEPDGRSRVHMVAS